MSIDNMTKDTLLTFFKEPTLENFSEFLTQTLGEGAQAEFKEEWINPVKLSKILMGMANAGGGCIVIGVAENDDKTLSANGIPENKKTYDPVEFSKIIESYFPQNVFNSFSIKNFFYDNDVYGSLKGKRFQVIFVSVNAGDLPIICARDGQSGKDTIYRGDIYIRRGSGSERINYEELQLIIAQNMDEKQKLNRDIELTDELKQLKALYDAIPVTFPARSFSGLKQSPISMQLLGFSQNKVYPEKSFEEFLKEMIEEKEKQIKNAVLRK